MRRRVSWRRRVVGCAPAPSRRPGSWSAETRDVRRRCRVSTEPRRDDHRGERTVAGLSNALWLAATGVLAVVSTAQACPAPVPPTTAHAVRSRRRHPPLDRSPDPEPDLDRSWFTRSDRDTAATEGPGGPERTGPSPVAKTRRAASSWVSVRDAAQPAAHAHGNGQIPGPAHARRRTGAKTLGLHRLTVPSRFVDLKPC
jgi:hypothetical protein